MLRSYIIRLSCILFIVFSCNISCSYSSNYIDDKKIDSTSDPQEEAIQKQFKEMIRDPFEIAKGYFDNYDFEKAERKFKEIIKKNRNNLKESHYYLGMIYFQRDDDLNAAYNHFRFAEVESKYAIEAREMIKKIEYLFKQEILNNLYEFRLDKANNLCKSLQYNRSLKKVCHIVETSKVERSRLDEAIIRIDSILTFQKNQEDLDKYKDQLKSSYSILQKLASEMYFEPSKFKKVVFEPYNKWKTVKIDKTEKTKSQRELFLAIDGANIAIRKDDTIEIYEALNNLYDKIDAAITESDQMQDKDKFFCEAFEKIYLTCDPLIGNKHYRKVVQGLTGELLRNTTEIRCTQRERLLNFYEKISDLDLML